MPEDSNAPIVAMQGINKAFGAVQALSNVDLTLGRGEFIEHRD